MLPRYKEIDYKKYAPEIPEDKREAYFEYRPFGKGQAVRIDFLIYDQDGKFTLLEVKKPRHIHREANIGIAQILDYIVLAEKKRMNINKSYILTTRCDVNAIEVIERFNLPIDLILFSSHCNHFLFLEVSNIVNFFC